METTDKKPTRAQQVLARLQRETEEREALKGIWNSLIDSSIIPEDRQFNFWLQKFGFDVCEAGLNRLAVQFSKRYQDATEAQDADLLMGTLDCVRYASKTMGLIQDDLAAAKEKRNGGTRG